MSETIIMFIVLFIIMMALQFLGVFIARKYVDNLLELQTKDPNKLLKKLNSVITLILVPKYQRLLLKIEALNQLNDHQQLRQLYDDFNQTITKKHRVNPSVCVMILQRELSYYILNNDIAKATQANELLQACKEYKLNQFYSSIIDECDVCLQIYGRHNYSYIDKGKQEIENSDNKVVQGIWSYRLAYLYYIDDNKSVCQDYLTKAYDYLKDSELETMVKGVMDDNNNFNLVMI